MDTRPVSSGGSELSAPRGVQAETGRSLGKNATEGAWDPTGTSWWLPPEETLSHLGQRQVCSHTRSWPEAHIRLCSQAFFYLSLVISVNSHRATLPLRPKVCSQRRSGQDPRAAGLTRLVPAGCSSLDPISRMYHLPTSVLLL